MCFSKNTLFLKKDEEIHIDQMKHYLEGDYFYWNPLLTTPPGL